MSDYRRVNWRHQHYLVLKPLTRAIELAVGKYAKGRVLDIGCGNKPYQLLFDQKGCEYQGCDIAQSSLKKVDIICSAENIPVPDQSFDTVFSTQVIEHIPEPEKLLKEGFRVLRPGGFIIISGPMYWHLHEEPNDFYRFTEYGFKYLLEKTHFHIEEVLPNGGIWAMGGQSLIHAFALSKSRFFILRMARFIFFRLGIYALYNRIFHWLDKRERNYSNAINYVIVAKKI